MGKEVKISLAAVGVLAIILIAVLGRSMLRSGDAKPADAEKKIAASDSKTSDHDSKSKAKEEASASKKTGDSGFVQLEKPKFIPAQQKTPSDTSTSGGNSAAASSFRFVSDVPPPRGAPKSSPPSFMPKPPEPDDASRQVATRGNPMSNPASMYRNPFPMARNDASPKEANSAGTLPSAPAEHNLPPSQPAGSNTLNPYQRYGNEADTVGSQNQSMTPPYDARSPRYDSSTQSPRTYETTTPYRSSGSPYQTIDRSSSTNSRARFQPTSDRSDASYRPTPSAPSNSERFSLPGLTPAPAANGKYTVQPNDSFWKIAARLYGTGVYFSALAEHNRQVCPNPHRLRAGTVIDAPDVAELRAKYPSLCPSAEKEETRKRRESVGSTRFSAARGRVYVVQAGDTLYDIARYELEDAARWGEIVSLNKDRLGDDYDYLVPGMQLVLPTGSADSFQPAQIRRPSVQTATPSSNDSFRRY